MERRAGCGKHSVPENPDELQRMQAMDLHSYLPNDIHVKVDRMSMAHSLECRSPFMDHRVVDFALGLPREAKVNRSDKGKQILRDLVRRHVPIELVDRPKTGFTPPWEKWSDKMNVPELMAESNPIMTWSRFSSLQFRNQFTAIPLSDEIL